MKAENAEKQCLGVGGVEKAKNQEELNEDLNGENQEKHIYSRWELHNAFTLVQKFLIYLNTVISIMING